MLAYVFGLLVWTDSEVPKQDGAKKVLCDDRLALLHRCVLLQSRDLVQGGGYLGEMIRVVVVEIGRQGCHNV